MFTKLRDTLRAVFGRDRFESDLDAEIADHIAKYTDELLARGVPLAEAHRRALREFGVAEQIKDEVRDAQGITFVDSASRNVRFAVRALRRNPVFSLTAIATLAVGIGATTAGFSVVNAVLLRDLPYPDSGRLYRLFSIAPANGNMATRDLPTLTKDHPGVEAAALTFSRPGRLTDPQGVPHDLNACYVTEQFFSVFGIPMFLGKSLRLGGGPQQLILAYETWRDVFASDPNIVGKQVPAVDLGTRVQRTVVGVAPPGFREPENAAYWGVLGLDAPKRGYPGYIRLRPGVTMAQLQDQLRALSVELGPDPDQHRNVEFVARPLLETIVGDLGPTVKILFGASSLLLLIACINVANLMLSRGIQRTREMAIREALGAKRGHIIRTLWTEAFLLSVVGGAAGLALGMAGVQALVQIAPEGLPRLDSVSLDSRILLFCLAATLATAFLTGLTPAIRISRADLRSLINDGGRGSSAMAAQHGIFGGLVIAEIALSVVLVIGAGLLMRSYVNLATSDPGFNPNNLMTAFVQVNTPTNVGIGSGGLPFIPVSSYEPVRIFFDELIERIRAIPGVKQASGGGGVPLGGKQGGPNASVPIVGHPVNDRSGALPQAIQIGAHPDFFRVAGAKIIAGRSLRRTDTMDAPGVIVVNEAFVKRFLPGENPIGKRVNLPDQFFKPGKVGSLTGEIIPDQVEIVGVVGDIKYTTLAEVPEPTFYLSSYQFLGRGTNIFIRSSGAPPETLIPAIRAQIAAMDKTIDPKFTTYSAYLRAALARQRMGTTLLAVFSCIALLLAAVGIYGLMSYSVVQRKQEMAVRAAMGASGRELRGLIVRRGLRLAVTGTVLGIIGAVLLRKVVVSQLYEVSALDMSVFLTVPLVLLAVAVLSSYVPALRAAKADPAVMLRSD